MPSRPFDTGWDFGPVLDLIDSDVFVTSPARSPISEVAVPVHQNLIIKNTASQQSLHLGNFGKLFEELNLSSGNSLPPISPVELDSEEPASSDDTLVQPLVEVKDIKPASKNVVKSSSPTKEQWDLIGDPFAGMTKKQRRKAQKKIAKEQEAQAKLEKGRLRKGKSRKDSLLTKNDNAPVSAPQTPPAQKRELKPVESIKAELLKSETLRKDLVQSTRARLNKSPVKQIRAQSRSNVGAKIRPTTPIPVNASIDSGEQPSSPVATVSVIAKGTRSASPTKTSKSHSNLQKQPLNSLAQPFTFRTETDSPPPRHVTSQPIAAEYRNYGAQSLSTPWIEQGSSTQMILHPYTPVPHTSSPLPYYSNGYFVPQVPGSAVHGHSLVPRTVQPAILQRPQQHVVIPQQAQFPTTPGKLAGPITIRPQTERHCNFFQQLMNTFQEDRKWLVSPMQLCNEKTSIEGIHVFVDASNIMIGFKDILKKSGVQLFDMSFDSLALLMERRRPVAKRVFAASHREAAPLPHVTRLVETSKAVGYENNVKEQVFIRREDNDRKKFFKDVERVGWHKAIQRRSGNGSGSDSETSQPTPTTPSAPKWVEQGVDEILHLKMCQSIIDTEVPTTMVLATGDGAEAEHSDGFLAHVERALKKGWKVELVSWKQQTNGGYKNKRFRTKWGDQFKIIELDDYVESLINTPSE